MQNKTAFGVFATATATAGLLFTASPAFAQTAEDFVPDCAIGVLAYSPGTTAATASDTTPVPGQTITLNSGPGSFDPGTAVDTTFGGDSVGTQLADDDGSATTTITVPADAAPGVFLVVFNGVLDGVPNVIGVCFEVPRDLAGGGGGPATPPEAPAPPAPVDEPITGGVGAPVAAPDRPSALPFTGSVELLAVAGLGAALVAAGAGTVVVARRRRDGAVTA